MVRPAAGPRRHRPNLLLPLLRRRRVGVQRLAGRDRRRRDLPGAVPPAARTGSATPHYGTYEQLADDLVEALAPHLDRPFAFFAHCAGALPAYETVLRLAGLGLPHRGACSCPASRPRTTPPATAC
ncbi:thioesterase domain-containing protein [Streptomyces sp. KL116D]|uniref:thioesterase domain-containing protein n=1 Tax=Streptomyces sp. KL116D TaxID=3045152 RepID=UPI00355871A2